MKKDYGWAGLDGGKIEDVMGSWDKEAACVDFACAWYFWFLQTRNEDADLVGCLMLK